MRLEFIGLSNDVHRARGVSEALAGRLLCDERRDQELPFRALFSAITDNPENLLEAADVGAYVVCRRVMKPRPPGGSNEEARLPGVIGLFTMVHHPGLSHREADDHWRDHHTLLAFEHHPYMVHYTQLSVVHRIHGPEWDGFALCGFDSTEDLRERFFGTPEGKIAIRNDVGFFADTKKSPRRLIVTESSWEPSS